jgi:hypothetical protein
MKRQTAWNGFYKTLREIKKYEAQAKAGDGHGIQTKWRMADMRIRKYAKSLIMEHGWGDVHTAQYGRLAR